MNHDISIRMLDGSADDLERLASYLHLIDDIFPIPLSRKVDIDSYAAKALARGIAMIAELAESLSPESMRNM